MSLVSIYTNKDHLQKILETDIDVYDVINNNLNNQYDMMRNNLNKNMLNKRYFDKNTKDKTLEDALYQHIYSHNHIALEDEIFETLDAFRKWTSKYNNKEDLLMAELLLLEEAIDMYHFILEYTCILEEHYLLTLLPEGLFNYDSLDYYYTGNNDFSNSVKEMLISESFHINRYIRESKDLNLHDMFNIDLELYSLLELNRNFIRLCNFKDWKKYESNYYSPYRFGELFNINREMYVKCINIISTCINTINYLLNIELEYDLDSVFKIINATYLTKREENIRRQLNDPRYTGKAEGEIVGVEV